MLDGEQKISIDELSKKLESIISTLRSENGCPWDKQQKIENCAEYILEETCEAIEAIEKKDINGLCEELGDILSQVFMISQIAKENSLFDISDVFDGIIQKLIFRHPHVFGEEKASNSEQVLKIWNRQKLIEKKDRKNYIDGIPKTLPADLYLLKMFRKLLNYEDFKPYINKFIDESLLNLENDVRYLGDDLKDYLKDFSFSRFNMSDFSKNTEFDVKETQNKSQVAQKICRDLLLLITFFAFKNDIDPELALKGAILELQTTFENWFESKSN